MAEERGCGKKLLEAYQLVTIDRIRKTLERAIAASGMSMDQIAYRLNTTSQHLHARFARDDLPLDLISDIALAIGCEIKWEMRDNMTTRATDQEGK